MKGNKGHPKTRNYNTVNSNLKTDFHRIVAQSYNKMADSYDEINSEAFYINQYKVYERAFRRCISEIKNKDVLDLGCGTGIQTIGLAKYARSVIGFDIAIDLIKKAVTKSKNYKNISYLRADAISLPFRTQSFDYISSYGEAISHIPEYEMVFSEVARVLKPGGYFTFSILNKWCFATFHSFSELNNALKNKKGHWRIWRCSNSNGEMVELPLKTFSFGEINNILKKYGFMPIRFTGIHILSSFIPLNLQYNGMNWWSKLFILLGKLDNCINHFFPFNAFGYTIIVQVIKTKSIPERC